MPDLPTLGTGHFAFMRSVLQGVDPATAWRRYLSTNGKAGTQQDIRRAIDGVRDAFAVAARQHRRPGTARLVLLDVAGGTSDGIAAPCLADFVAVQALEGFSEAEQFALYEQHFGARNRRRARLVARQLEALNWLQRVAPDRAQQAVLIADWLAPGLAMHLAAAGLVRTEDLQRRIAGSSRNWWFGIDCIGATKAARIVAAMPGHGITAAGTGEAGCSSIEHHHQGTLQSRQITGAAWAVPDDAPRTPGMVLIAPLRRQVACLLASAKPGLLRAPRARCKIAATDDLEAVRCWLHTASPSVSKITSRALSDAVPQVPGWELLDNLSNTQRAYWKEAERFLLWLSVEQGRSLSALTVQDCSAYAAFLGAPGVQWCGRRGRGKEDWLWRPFEGPLGPRAQAYATGILRSMYRFLVTHGYLAESPWEAARATLAVAMQERVPAVRQRFDMQAWQIIEQTTQRLAPSSANSRLRVAIDLLRSCDARLGDLVQASVDDLEAPRQAEQPWLLHLPPRGARPRTAVLHADAVQSLQSYFLARGLQADLQAPGNRGARLLGRAMDAPQRAPWAPCAREPVDPRAGIGHGTLADQLRMFFQLCARACADDANLAMQFQRANSRSLRGSPVAQGPRMLSPEMHCP